MKTTQAQAKTLKRPAAGPSPFAQPKRAYTPPAPASANEAPDLATQRQQARQHGHSLSRMTVQAHGLHPRGPGRTLPKPVQQKMEKAFGHDFSSVRVHEDDNARSIGATAYTRGEHVHFARGRYQPHSPSGQRLLGHELTHVVQQRQGRVSIPQGKGVPINADGGLEREADELGHRAASGRAAPVRGMSTGVQRKAVVGGGGVVQCQGEEHGEEEPLIPQPPRPTLGERFAAWKTRQAQAVRTGGQRFVNWVRGDHPVGRGAMEMTAAHSPGIYTGPVTTTGVVSNARQFGEAAKQGFNSKSLVDNLSNNSPKWVNNLSTASTIASGTGDVVAMGQTAYNVHKARRVLNNPHADRSEKKLARSQVKAGGVDLATQSTDLLSQGASLTSTFAPHASTLSHAAGVAAPALSVPVNAVVGTRAAWRAGRAGMHEHRLNTLLQKPANQGLGAGNMRNAAEFTRDKMKSRKRRNLLGLGGAALGVGGGIALGLGALGVGAAMATPIGWGLAAAAGAVGLGLGAYKLYRYIKKRRQKGTGQGLGEEREAHANNIHTAINRPINLNPNHPHEVERQEAHRLLSARGIDPEDVRGAKGREVLKEKMASW